MVMFPSPCKRSLTLLFAASFASAAPQSSRQVERQVERIGPDGVSVLTEEQPGHTTAYAGVPGPGNLLWQASDAAAIPDSVALSGASDESWVAQTLNAERLELFQTTGNGQALFADDYLSDDASEIEVAAAEDLSFAAALLERASGDLVVRGYTGASSTPDWTYTFDAGFDQFNRYALDVSADGSTLLAVGFTGGAPQSLLVSLDPATGAELERRTFASFVASLELSSDGSRAVVTDGASAHVIDGATLATIFSFNVSGSGGDARISADGSTVAAGGFNLRAYRDTGSGFALAFSQSDASQWYGQGLALSGDGATLFSGSTTYTTNLTLTFRVIDLPSGSELARTTRTGSGGFQDSVRRAGASADGTIFAAGTWGNAANSHPEVLVFDRDLNQIGAIDTPGSVFDLDLSPDGRFVLAGSKAVHANEFGSGGEASLLELDFPLFYCTPKVSSAGCVATLATSSFGQPVSGAADYAVIANGAQGEKPAILFFGGAGPAAIPFSGGTLCVQPPLGRTPFLYTAGSSASACDGSFDFIVNDGVSNTDPGPGGTIWFQGWIRDPDNGSGNQGTALTDGVALSY